MKSAKPERIETTLVEYSSLKKEGEKPMTTATATTSRKKVPAGKVTSKVNVAKQVTKKTAAKKTVSKKVSTKYVDTKKAPVEMTKREVAQGIFDTHFQKKARKDILVMFQNEAKLTKAGSATYYANMKRKFEETEG